MGLGTGGSPKDRAYKVEVLSVYTFDGKTYCSNRCDFTEILDAEEVQKRAIVRALPTGSHATCYVNPDKPEEAVISHGTARNPWTLILLIGAFAIGSAGLLFSFKFPRPAGQRGEERNSVDDQPLCERNG